MSHNIRIFEHPQSGLKVIFKKVYHSEIIHTGIIINVGSGDENKDNNGIAHLIEHTVFKGTQKRSPSQILQTIENVGGEINAYTTREKTCYYTSTLKRYLGKSIDVLTDLVFNSKFPLKEIEKEKKVISEEIDMYDDTPEESIYDEFYEYLFNGHPLGFNILGKKSTLSSQTKSDIENFSKENYGLANTVLSIVGNTTEEEIIKILNSSLNKDTINGRLGIANKDRRLDVDRQNSTLFSTSLKKEFTQAHCVIGGFAYSKHDDKRFPFSLLNEYLGGGGMSSRLNLLVRERHGLTYSINSSFTTYQQIGTFSIYFACENKNLKKCKNIIFDELDRLCQHPLNDKQLNVLKNQTVGQIALLQDNYNAAMQNAGKNYLDYNKYFTYTELEELVQQITVNDLHSVAQEMFDKNKLSSLTYLSQ